MHIMHIGITDCFNMNFIFVSPFLLIFVYIIHNMGKLIPGSRQFC